MDTVTHCQRQINPNERTYPISRRKVSNLPTIGLSSISISPVLYRKIQKYLECESDYDDPQYLVGALN